MHFSDLGLISPLLKALDSEGYSTPTAIQEQSIPVILQGKDLFGCAQTGTGKTASFALPTLQLLSEHRNSNNQIQALILTPTRELAIQIGENFSSYGKHLGLRHTVIFGGVGQAPQVKTLRKGVDILIATPGRLLDLMNQKHINIGNIKIFILDEADRMLDMGFIHDVKKIVSKLPHKRQTLFFSATMPPAIMDLAHTILKDPVKVEVTPVSSTVDTVGQSLYYVEKQDKKELLLHILMDKSIQNAIVFTRTKHGADKVATVLNKAGVKSMAIHGNKSQGARQKALSDLKSNDIRVLVATDIAARGIDVDMLSHVIIYDVPTEPETYVHRIGRTGRAGASGKAIVFSDTEEKKYIKDIQKLIKQDIPVISDHPFTNGVYTPTPKKQQRPPRNNTGSSGQAHPRRDGRYEGRKTGHNQQRGGRPSQGKGFSRSR